MDRKKTKAKIGPRLAAVLIGLMTYVLLFGLLIAAARPEQYDLKVGQVSPLTITATKDVEDTVTTQQLIDAAVAAVQPNSKTRSARWRPSARCRPKTAR